MKKSNILKMVYCLFVCVFTAMAVWISTAEVEASFGDPFDGDGLKNPDWQWQNEPEKWDVGETREGFLYIDSEHDRDRNLWASDMSHFLYQETETDVFDVETHFFSRWATDSGVNGLLVKSEAETIG